MAHSFNFLKNTTVTSFKCLKQSENAPFSVNNLAKTKLKFNKRIKTKKQINFKSEKKIQKLLDCNWWQRNQMNFRSECEQYSCWRFWLSIQPEVLLKVGSLLIMLNSENGSHTLYDQKNANKYWQKLQSCYSKLFKN